MGIFDNSDTAYTRKIIESAQSSLKRLQSIRACKTQCESNIREIFRNMRRSEAEKILADIPIEQINIAKDGIRVNLLKSYGIQNMLQISRFSQNELEMINGIGANMAEKIVRNAATVRAGVEKNIKVRLETGTGNKNIDTIIADLYLLREEKDIYEKAERLYENYAKGFEGRIQLASGMLNPLVWLVTPRWKKDAMTQAVNEIADAFYGRFGQEFTDLNERHQQAFRDFERKSQEDFKNQAATYYAVMESLVGTGIADDKVINGLPEELAVAIDEFKLDTSNFKATLRRYQEFGAKYILHQQRTLLGDEMGLGKTVQAIAAMAHWKSKGLHHFIVVCPLSVLVNWKREIALHSTLDVVDIYGEHREKQFEAWLNREDAGVAVTTYETLNRLNVLEEYRFGMVVVDEAHYIKNPETIRTKSVMNLLDQTDNVLFMSGTPLENRVEEMCFLIECLRPQVAAELEKMKEMSMAPQFREKAAPVYLRRKREDVLTELPDLAEKEEWCVMNAKEEMKYRQALVSNNFMAVRQISWNVEDIEDSSKATRLMEICNNAQAEGRKIIIFSFFKEVINSVTKLLGDRVVGVIDGSVNPQRRQGMIDELKEAPEGSVIVCQIQAGGVGLNIQCASVVIFCEPQLKPSLESQAVARAYRMGQTQKVMVHRLLMDETVDERILELLKSKIDIFDHFADDSAVAEADMRINENQIMSSIIAEELKKYNKE